MKIKYRPDNRVIRFKDIEINIQKRANRKDKKFILTGNWKKFVRKEGKLSIYSVDGEWVRNNLSVIFGHGGHGLVHEFIPMNEIWISNQHFPGCGCKNINSKTRNISINYFESTIVHEITEFKAMKKGMTYWRAHYQALKAEVRLGFLRDPYTENYQ